MVEAYGIRSRAKPAVKKAAAAPPIAKKKGGPVKKGKKGKGGGWDEAQFERDMLRAIEASKVSAGLVQEGNPG